MAAPALRPRSATEIVDASFQILRAHYGQFVMCAAIAYVPLLIYRLWVGDQTARLVSGEPTLVQQGILWNLADLFANSLVMALMSAVLIVLASQAYLGDEVDAGEAVRRALPRLPLVLIAALLRFAMMLVALLLFLFPVLYVVARYFAVTPAIVLEDAGIGASFDRSSRLSRGRKWHVLNTLGLVTLIYWALIFGIGFAASLVLGFMMQVIVSSVVVVMIQPVVAIALALLYYDARIQSEGLDIELMAGALAPAPAAGQPAR